MVKKTKAGTPSATGKKEKSKFLDWDVLPEPQYEEGPERTYFVTDVPPAITASRRLGKFDWPLLALLVMGCFYVRLGKLSQPDLVVFDEVHFGKFAKKYIVGDFFMDVHPPLAKMLFAAVSSLAGFTGNFDFEKIGDKYPLDVPYVVMRAFPAILGSATVLLLYLTLRSSGVRPTIAFLTATCLLVENSFITISRYILLDAPLLFFIAAAIYAFKKFETQQPFSVDWFRALLSCSISLGLALSSKWVGLFTIAWVGILCAWHIWLYIGDLRLKLSFILKNSAFRASFLLIIPAVLYMGMFYVHFMLLSQDTQDSGFFSSAFRADLQGSTVPQGTEAPIGYGSVVTLRHLQTKGGYLHSHEHFYPAGSKQQQITLYPHLDTNNEWVIEPYNFSTPDYFVPIKDDTKVRLRHAVTSRRLHSHDEKPPVSDRDWQKEVSCYGHDGFEGDANDDWIFEVVKHKTPKNAQDEVKAIQTVFRLRHAMSGLYLFSSEVKLPEWGFGQQEVTAASQGARSYTHWIIESNTNPYLNYSEPVSYPKLTFFQKFLESHKVMWTVNQGLTSHHNWQSQPYEWPVLFRGINYWARHHTQIYLIGNPVVWWTAGALMFAFCLFFSVTVLVWLAGKKVIYSKESHHFNYQMFTYVLGWATHYFPFFIMGRQLFLHHYLPAQYFAILGMGQFFELMASSKYMKDRKFLFVVITAFTALSYVSYSLLLPLIDASPWTRDQCVASKLITSWDYDCNNFFDKIQEYDLYEPTEFMTESVSAADTSVVIEAASSVQEFDQQQQNEQQPPMSGDLESPPPAETHGGEVHLDENGNVVVPEEVPAGEMYDEATTGSVGAEPQTEEPKEHGQDVVVEDVLVDDVVVEDFVVKDVPESSIDLRIEE